MKRKIAQRASALEQTEMASNNLYRTPHKKQKSQQISLIDDFESASSISAQSSSPNGKNELVINEEYAKRFEHNKKREERHRCMYGELS